MAYFPYGGKSIFYEEFGQGSPVLFLHGNTASSKMFELLMPLYAEKFRCILLDFLGNGRSDRVERFSPDLWQEEARQTIALVEYLQCGKVSLVGTSGGAWAAVNAALLRPDLFHAVVTDSFDGRTLNARFADNLLHLHGDSFFDLLDEWFHDVLILGTTLPRDDMVIRHSMTQALKEDPAFEPLKAEPRFQNMVSRLEQNEGET